MDHFKRWLHWIERFILKEIFNSNAIQFIVELAKPFGYDLVDQH